MSIHLVTGFAGKEHITSADQGSFNAGMLGTGKYVMNTGNKLAAEIVSNNLVKIKDGDLVNQGRHIRIASDDYEECTIQNGTQARYRNDLIVARYSKNSDTGIESISMVVIKGTASTSSTPPDPSYTSGDILNGALTDDFPLYRVKLNGLSITAVEPLFGDPVKSLSELNTDLYPIAYCKSFSKQVTLAANTRTDFGITITADEGYQYMGIANIDYSGSSSHLAIGKWSVWGNTCYISMQNLNNSQANVTVTINAMFIKSDCLRNN